MELNAWRSWCHGSVRVERVAALGRIHTIMREPGIAFVEAQLPGIGQVNVARGAYCTGAAMR
ncbi:MULTISPECIES: hypothetical protein [Burkholderia]|uniref:hypothetical protein n=1 Tax=Burkholderia TaxID=32008 RepID=UPI00117BFC36|nr:MULTISPECIES: hypothetical protein [Burkholderia]